MFGPLLFGMLLLPQQASQPTDSSFWRPGDARLAIATVAATGVLAIFDERIARWARSEDVQGDSSRYDAVRAATVINEVPLTIAALTVYSVGRLGKMGVVADVGAHVTESLVVTEVFSEFVRSSLGRVRPRASPNDAFEFEPGGGLRHFEDRSFPSLHAAVAFATAGALSEELRVRHSPAYKYLAPTLYVLATIPGFTRMYLDQHWASDVLAGSVVGAFIGNRIVRYSHSRRTRVDRVLLPPRVIVGSRSAMIQITLLR
jgi:membrane-associated phospholipid phosphatase